LDERRRAANFESFLGKGLEITTPATTGEYDGNNSFGDNRRGDCRYSVAFARTAAIGGITTKVWL
jgi:hypothetical protein